MALERFGRIGDVTMAPTWIVLLKEPLSEADYERVGELLRTLADGVRFDQRGYARNELGSWHIGDFRHPVYGVGPGEDLWPTSVEVSVDDMSAADVIGRFDEQDQRYLKGVGFIDQQDEYIRALGFFPAERLICDIPSRSALYVRLLGHVVLHLAELLGGYIDMNNEPALPAMHPERLDYDPPDNPWSHYGVSSPFPRPAELVPWRPTGPGGVFELYHSVHQRHVIEQAPDGRATARLFRRYHTVMDARFFRHYWEAEEVTRGLC